MPHALEKGGEQGTWQSFSRRQKRLRNSVFSYNDLIFPGSCCKLSLAQHAAIIPQSFLAQPPLLKCQVPSPGLHPYHLAPFLLLPLSFSQTARLSGVGPSICRVHPRPCSQAGTQEAPSKDHVLPMTFQVKSQWIFYHLFYESMGKAIAQ